MRSFANPLLSPSHDSVCAPDDIEVDYAPNVKVTKWRSPTTGLSLVYLNKPSPKIKARLVFGTEMADNFGIPWALTFLVSMGSKKYPYKDFIQRLENRFLSSTTNTISADHTRYFLDSYGWECFKTMLPIYLDHLFHPTLTDEAFLTEVYHIDGKGKEWFKSDYGDEHTFEIRKSLYAADSGYSFHETGLHPEIRKLKNSQVRDYHKAMYRPDNFCMVISGSIDEEELLSIMSDFDTQLLPLADQINKRPFVDSPQDLPLAETILKTVEIPAYLDFTDYREKKSGIIGWIGPESSNHIECVALDIVGNYIKECAVDYLSETCGEHWSDIYYSYLQYLRKSVYFHYRDSEIAEPEQVDHKFKSLLVHLADPKNIDLEKIIGKAKKKSTDFPNDHDFFDFAIQDFLYGNIDGSTLSAWGTYRNNFETLATWSAQQWSDLIKTYFVDNHSASVLFTPSHISEAERKKADKAWCKEIKKFYGVKGTQELKEKLRNAQAVNNTPIPDELRSRIGKPNLAKINFSKTESFAAGSNDGSILEYKKTGPFADAIKKDQPEGFPLFLHFEIDNSARAEFCLLMSTTTLSPTLLRYMKVFVSCFEASYIQLPSGEYVPCEEIHDHLYTDKINFYMDVPNQGRSMFQEFLVFSWRCKTSNYSTSIQLLIKCLKYTVFEESKIKNIIKVIDEFAFERSFPDTITEQFEVLTLYPDEVHKQTSNAMKLRKFCKHMLQQIEDGNFSIIKKDLESIRNHLFQVSNMKVFVVGGMSNITHPISSWASFVNEFCDQPNPPSWELTNIPTPLPFKTPIGEKCVKKAFIVSNTTDCVHIKLLTPMPTDHLHEDVYKIDLACQFLDDRHNIKVECDLMGKSSEPAYLSFQTQDWGGNWYLAQRKWEQAKGIISRYVTGEQELTESRVEDMMNNKVMGLVRKQNYRGAVFRKIQHSIFKKRGEYCLPDYLEKLNTYTSKDLIYAMEKYLLALFDSEKSVVFSYIRENEVNYFSEFLTSQGYEVSVKMVDPAVENYSFCWSDHVDSYSDFRRDKVWTDCYKSVHDSDSDSDSDSD